MMTELEHRVAVITGGSRGLGFAMARAFGQAGASVVIASRNQQSIDQAVDDLRRLGINACGMACNVGELEQVEALGAYALKNCGSPDIWVNNAGLAAPYGPTMDAAPQAFTQVVSTNILGTYHGCLVALRQMIPQGRGKLINILGRGSKKPAPMQNAYGATKSWLRSFTLALADEYKESGVGIFAFSPGMVRTDMLTRPAIFPDYQDRLGGGFQTVLRMWSWPAEIPARRAVWLASNATDGMTGKVIEVLGTRRLLQGAAAELLRRLTRRPAEPIDVQVQIVPPDPRAPAPTNAA
jgi:glucose 1-dehydrogenase